MVSSKEEPYNLNLVELKNFDKYKKLLQSNTINIKKVSAINIGQSLIMNGDRILALENFKGTSKMIELFSNNKSFNELIFVKFKKENQIN